MPQSITGGVWPAVITTWDDQHDQPDLDAQARLIQGFIDDDLDGLYLLGSTGKGVAMSVEHRKQVAEAAARANGGRVPLMVHVGAVSVHDAIELAKHAADCGADAISSVPPFYFPADVETVFEHYRLIAAATELPFFPYHHAGLSAAMPPADEYARRLMDLPHVAGIKFTSSDFFTFMRIRRLVGDRLVMFSGADELVCHGALSSADGAIGTFYNVWGKAVKRIRQRFLAGEVEAAERFMLTFAGALEQALFPRKKVRDFLRVAMRVRYGIEIGKHRSPGDMFDWDWDEGEVRALLETVDAAAEA